MKTLKLLSLIILITLSSCSSVRVNADYDKKVSFTNYKSYAYLKSGIDKAEISDLDKKRILRAIDTTLQAKGFSKSENPDFLVNISTKVEKNVNVNQFNAGYGYGWGRGWNPYFGMNNATVTTTTEGVLTIDFIDAKKKELFWQGNGTGYLTSKQDKKDKVAAEFVSEILAKYPPEKN
jgi:hypothetical protein